MNGCSAQPLRTRADRTLLLALAASAAIHLIGGVASSRVGLDAEPQRRLTDRAGWNEAGRMSLNFADAEEASAAQSAADAINAPEASTDPMAALPEPPRPKPIELALGIDGSTHATDNMIGFRDPTEHSAWKSEVDQPALDLNAGAADEALRAEGSPNARPDASSAPVGPPTPSLAEMAAAAMAAKQHQIGDGAESSNEITPLTADTDATLPESANGMTTGPLIDKAPRADRTREGNPKATSGRPDTRESSVAPAILGSSIAALFGKPGEGGNAPASNSASGDQPGKNPGIKSDKESDPSSRIKPIELHLGQTVAGDGIEIVTKRPNGSLLTKLTHVTKSYGNPGVTATFDASGKVTDVKVTRTSGAADEVDEPVMNMVFSWRARGPKLVEIANGNPNATFTLNFVILLR